MEKGMSSNPFILLQSVLDDDGWFYQRVSGKQAFWSRYKLRSTTLVCYFHITQGLDQFLFYGALPLQIDSERLPSVAEYIARINSSLRIGNFELDFDDCQLRYKSSVNFSNTELKAELIRGAVNPAIGAFNLYLPTLLAVINGEVSAHEAATQHIPKVI